MFFNELYSSLSKAVNEYENILVIGDLNIDMSIPNNDKNHFLSELCDTFDMQNLVKVKTCDKSQNGTSIDVILTNKPKSFYRTIAIETGLSDHHKLIATFLRCQYQRLPPKTIIYRSTKNLDNEKFLKDIENIHVDEINRFSDPFTGYLTLYKSVVDRHCPIKKKRIRGNEQPFMDKDLSKAIKDRSRIRNKYNKWKSRENYIAYQNIKKTCKFLTNRAKQNHFDNVLKNNNIMTNKDFWKLVRPALSEKNSDYESKIVLKENEEYISDEKQLVEIFNNHYINIVENSTGRPPTSISAPEHLRATFYKNLQKPYSWDMTPLQIS